MRRILAVGAAVALAACSRELSVPPARPLTVAPATASVAPRERIAFTAEDGAGGYRYALSGAPGSGADAEIDATTGVYRAGSTGPGTDVVVVTDQAGATASATISVGAMLAISPQVALVAPGGTATFSAEGGLPPYTFTFQAKGNRSGGRIDGVTGEYTAGPNPGTQDKVEVTDAAGAVARPAGDLSVGALHLPLPGGASELELGDLNGDGRGDVVALEPQQTSLRRLTATLLLPGGARVAETYFLTYASAISAVETTGDGRADVLVGMYGGQDATLYAPDPSGHLAPADSLGVAGLPRLPYVVASSGFTGCAPSASGIYRVAWDAAAAGFDPPTCVTSMTQADVSHVGDLVAGDFDRNGAADVAWLERDVYTGPVFGTGNPRLHFGTATARLLPVPAGGYSAALPTGGARQQVLAGRFRSQTVTDAAVLLQDPGGRNVVKIVQAFTTATAPTWADGELDPFPKKPPALGIARCPALPGGFETLAAWNGTLRPALATVDASGVATLSTASVAAVHVPVSVAACGDVNGDGVPDLALASDSTSTLAVLWGDGDGGFGRRPRFQATPVFTMAQVDGDGIGDVVVATEAPSLVTLLGDEHQLGRVAETPLSLAPAGIWAGDLGGSAVAGWASDLVIADTSSNLYTALGSASGVFGRVTQLRDAPDADARIPRILRVAFAALGGAARGDDVVVLYEIKPAGSVLGTPTEGTYELDAIVRAQSGSPQVVTTTFTSYTAPDVQPVDLDGDALDELVVAQGQLSVGNPAAWRPLRMRVDRVRGTIASVGALPAFTNAPSPITAVGRLGDVAAFAGGALAEFVWGIDPSSVATATLPGGLSVPPPRTIGNVITPLAALGAVTAPLGTPDLVFADGTAASLSVRVLPGVLAHGRLAGYGAATTAKAPGTFAGIVPQGAAAPADVLVFTGEELLPLSWADGVLR